MDEIREERGLIRNAIHTIGYPLDEFDRSYKDLKLKTSRIDLEAREAYRDEIRDVHGHPRLKQMEFDLEHPRPEAANVAVRWNVVGYQDGLQGMACDPKAAGVPPEAIQDYNQGWGQGQTVVAMGLKSLEAEPPQVSAAEAGGQPDWSSWPEDNDMWSVDQKERFCDWYELVPADVTPLIPHPGAAAEFKRLEALEREGDPAFEAPAAEITKQAGRKGGKTDKTDA